MGYSSLHWLVSALKKLFFLQWSVLDKGQCFNLESVFTLGIDEKRYLYVMIATL